ncbi:hypothetical protein GGR58DRAFT_65972 [Xylaria digitata]|nr:hypothetical protein GGR58DRAFT_65972 [Xylaria digitata]
MWRFVRIIAVILSSLLPILSIVVLYLIKSRLIRTRLYTIITFLALWSLTSVVLTDARESNLV